MKNIVYVSEGNKSSVGAHGGGKLLIQNEGPGKMVVRLECIVEIEAGQQLPVVGKMASIVIEAVGGDVRGLVAGSDPPKQLGRLVVKGTGTVKNPGDN